MATQTIKTIIKFRRADASEWPLNYVLDEGEPGFELDTGKLKIGNGETPWSELDYLNGTAILNTDGALEYSEGTLSLAGLLQAETGQVPSKTLNGALTWITPITEENIIHSNQINTWIESKIENISNRTYMGDAYLISVDNEEITLLNEELEPIEANTNDVYSYNNKKYIWTGTKWIELTTTEFYVTQDELATIISRLNNIENETIPKASNSSLGIVQGSNEINKVTVDENGIMSVNSIGIDKLVNNGYTLILNGGQSR